MKNRNSSRRKFIEKSAKLGAGMYLMGLGACSSPSTEKKVQDDKTSGPWFSISLAQWSLHKMLQAGELSNLDFAAITREKFNIGAIEYVNQFFEKGTDKDYIKELNKRAIDSDVKQLLIMIDGEGDLGDPDDNARKKAVINHYKWVEAEKTLGCHSIRVNAFGEGPSSRIMAATLPMESG